MTDAEFEQRMAPTFRVIAELPRETLERVLCEVCRLYDLLDENHPHPNGSLSGADLVEGLGVALTPIPLPDPDFDDDLEDDDAD